MILKLNDWVPMPQHCMLWNFGKCSVADAAQLDGRELNPLWECANHEDHDDAELKDDQKDDNNNQDKASSNISTKSPPKTHATKFLSKEEVF